MSRNRAHSFTWNNYPSTYAAFFAGLDSRYIVAAEEVAPGTGTPHLQGYIVWTNAKTVSAVRAILRGCHVEISKGSHSQNDRYCRKTRAVDVHANVRVYSRGELPSDPADRGRVERDRWEAAWIAAKAGDLESIPADIRVRLVLIHSY